MKAKPVILSGGSGVRLWPISRKNLAKQFVDIFQNDGSLFLDAIKEYPVIHFIVSLLFQIYLKDLKF